MSFMCILRDLFRDSSIRYFCSIKCIKTINVESKTNTEIYLVYSGKLRTIIMEYKKYVSLEREFFSDFAK